MQPHRVEYWLNAKPDDPVAFAAEVAAVCAVYQHAPAVAQQGEHVISTDEKTGIQALERAAPTLPMQPGLVERPEYEYLRHGTQCLIANFDVATGEVVRPLSDQGEPKKTLPRISPRRLLLIQRPRGSLSWINSTRISPRLW